MLQDRVSVRSRWRRGRRASPSVRPIHGGVCSVQHGWCPDGGAEPCRRRPGSGGAPGPVSDGYCVLSGNYNVTGPGECQESLAPGTSCKPECEAGYTEVEARAARLCKPTEEPNCVAGAPALAVPLGPAPDGYCVLSGIGNYNVAGPGEVRSRWRRGLCKPECEAGYTEVEAQCSTAGVPTEERTCVAAGAPAALAAPQAPPLSLSPPLTGKRAPFLSLRIRMEEATVRTTCYRRGHRAHRVARMAHADAGAVQRRWCADCAAVSSRVPCLGGERPVEHKRDRGRRDLREDAES